MIEDKVTENDSPVFCSYERIKFFFSLLLIGQIISVGGCIGLIIGVSVGIDNASLKYFVAFVVGILIFITFYLVRKSKSSYEIYEDRIDFFSVYKPSQRETVKINEIFQVRFEDEFKQKILLYLKEDHTSNLKRIKNNRFDIFVKSDNLIDDLIIILKFFKNKNKEVYISTKHKEINVALDLKNWIEPPFVNHKLIDAFLRFLRQ